VINSICREYDAKKIMEILEQLEEKVSKRARVKIFAKLEHKKSQQKEMHSCFVTMCHFPDFRIRFVFLTEIVLYLIVLYRTN